MPKEENYLARSISQAGMEARYDESVKRLLANKMILATIMKECLEEYHLCTVEEIAEKYIEGEPQVSKVGVHTDETHPAAERKNPGYPLLKRAIYQIGESFPYLINAPRRCAGIRRCMMPAKAAPNPAPRLASES